MLHPTNRQCCGRGALASLPVTDRGFPIGSERPFPRRAAGTVPVESHVDTRVASLAGMTAPGVRQHSFRWMSCLRRCDQSS